MTPDPTLPTAARSTQTPPEAWGPLFRVAARLRYPLERFLHVEAASGVLLLVAAAVAMAWANSPWGASYRHFWHTPLGFRLGALGFERPLEWWVNDGLMVVFFFVVGLEIRREMHQGELSEWRRAALPVAGALGGMLVPAAVYLLVAGAPETRSGWGVPMATDIAFAVGILTLLGRRVPPSLRVLLLALAVIDDLGAIIVIALFYSSGIALSGLAVGVGGLLTIFLMQRVGVRSKLSYVAPALLAWAGVYASGIHPTIAGVAIGLLTPVRAWKGPEGFASGIKAALIRLEGQPLSRLPAHELSSALHEVEDVTREAIAPAEALIGKLHPWVAFAIMPIFALANAGVPVAGGVGGGVTGGVVWGVALGLVVGKPLGVLLASALALRLRIGVLPSGVGARHLVVLGIVAGVGFTMALFIAQLAFVDPALLAAAKLGVLLASGGAAVLALGLGYVLLPSSGPGAEFITADEAESSVRR